MTTCGLACVLAATMIFFAGLVNADLVESDIYLAGEHYSEWLFEGSSAKCELKHEVPQFGIGRFLRLAGETLKFHFDNFQPVPEAVDGVMREITPSWKHETRADPLTTPVKLNQGLRPLQLKRKDAAWLLSSLANGQMPSIDFLDWDDSRKKVHVRLSPVNFQKAYRDFKRCLKQISNKGFDEFRESEVHFDLDVHLLRQSDQLLLEELTEYILADSSISQIVIDGHADDQGTPPYNLKLSRRRANSVESYLTKAGVDPRLIQTHAYGESRLKLNSRSESARAVNRRAEIQLRRE